MPNFTIRPGTLNDLPTIKHLMLNLYHSDRQYDPHFNDLQPEANAEEEYTHHILDHNSICYLAERDGEIIGCLTGSLSIVPDKLL